MFEDPNFEALSPSYRESKVNLARFHSWTYHWSKFAPWWSYVKKLYMFRRAINAQYQNLIADEADPPPELADDDNANDATDVHFVDPAASVKQTEIVKWLKTALPNKHSFDVATDIMNMPDMKSTAWGTSLIKV